MRVREAAEVVAQLSVESDASIRTAMRAIDRGGVGAALLVAKDGRFAGIVTDGDVRRGLLNQQLTLDSPVALVPRPVSKTASVSDRTTLNQLFSESIRLVPILDADGFVVDLAMLERRVRLPVAAPSLNGRELEYLADCVQTGWISSTGAYVRRFEETFAAFVGVPHAMTTSNGTTALHLALLALGIGAGDEVIVPTLSFIATANAVRHAGATPVFVDSEPETWNIDPMLARAAVTPRTKAIMPVHLYGHPADMEPLLQLAREYGLAVIEDAAEAHGARYRGVPVGAIGDIGAFSFFGNKIVTTGEGGMLTTGRQSLADAVRVLRDHGMEPGRRYWHPVLGYNYRLTNLQAAIGLAQMERVDAILAGKARLREMYDRRLAAVAGLRPQARKPDCEPVCWLYSLVVEPEFGCSRDDLMARLSEEGIDTRPLFIPMHQQPVYARGEFFPVAERLSSTGISLPSAANLSEGEVERVCDAIEHTGVQSRAKVRSSAGKS